MLPTEVLTAEAQEQIDLLFGTRFGYGFVRPLPITRGYRDAPSFTIDARYRRRVVCVLCNKRGCQACGHAGWGLRGESVTVTVPAGAAPGTRLRIVGLGDELAGVGFGTADLLFELVEPGPRADELARAQQDHENGLAIELERSRARRQEQTRRGRAEVLVGLLFLAVAVLLLVWLLRR